MAEAKKAIGFTPEQEAIVKQARLGVTVYKYEEGLPPPDQRDTEYVIAVTHPLPKVLGTPVEDKLKKEGAKKVGMWSIVPQVLAKRLKP